MQLSLSRSPAILLLGPPEILIGERRVRAFSSRKSVALLSYLARQRQPVLRSQLAFLLWGEKLEALGRRNLSRELSQLAAIIPGAFDADYYTVALAPQYIEQVDTSRFETLARDVARGHARPDLAALDAALALYRGEFLAGLYIDGSPEFETWLLRERELWQRQTADLLAYLLAHHVARRDDERAEHYARRWLAIEPWQEEAHRALMQLLARSGRRGEALNQYAICQRALAEELDVEPAEETARLAEQIRSGVLDTDLVALRSRAFGATHSSEQPPALAPRAASDLPYVGLIVGRQHELQTLRRWLIDDQCHVIAIVGMGGMGKSSVAATLGASLADRFDRVIWRSLINAPQLGELLRNCIQALSAETSASVPVSLDSQLDLLLSLLRDQRCLLILDNLESLLQTGTRAGAYRPGYADYEQLIARVGQGQHKSCLVLTSRERPLELEQLVGTNSPVRVLHLAGLDLETGLALLRERGLDEAVAGHSALVEHYSGNPLALKLVAATIRDLFKGDAGAFLRDEAPIFDDIRDVLDEQFERLAPLERELMVWLAIEREPTSIAVLQTNLVNRETQRAVLEALRSLQRRSLLEQHGQGFTLQNVVMEYTTDLLVAQVVQELEVGQLGLFARHALSKAQSPEYVRQSQIRLILGPVTECLTARLGQAALLTMLRALPAQLRGRPQLAASYAAGNVLAMLIHLGDELVGLDLAGLSVWQADLRGARTPGLNLAHADLRGVAFTQNMRAITSVAFSPDGQLFAAGAIDGTVFLWHFAERRLIRAYTGHTALINSVVFSSDGATLASGASDETIRLWDLADANDARVIQAHAGGVIGLAFSSRGMLASSGYDGAVRIWDTATATLRHTVQQHAPLTLCLAWSPDGSTLLSSGYDPTIYQWDAATGASLGTLQGHTDIVPRVTYNPDGCLIASGGGDRTIRLWDAHTGLPVHVLEGHTNVVTALGFSPTSGLLASGSWDQTVRLWDLRTGQLVALLAGHTSYVSALVFSPDGVTLVTGGYDQTIRLWDVQTRQLRTMLRGHTSWIWALAFSPDGATLASAHHDQVVRLWGTSSRAVRATLEGQSHEVTTVAISPDGTTLASAGNDRKVRLWDVGTGQLARVFAGHTAAIHQVRYSPDGKWLASGDVDGTVWIWDLHDDRHRSVHHGQRHSAGPVAWGRQPESSDLLLATPTDEFGIQLWNARTGQPLRLLRGHSAIITALAMSMRGALLVSGSWDLTVRLWDVTTGQLTRILHGHTNYVMATALSPDETLVASGSLDGTVRVWDCDHGSERHCLLGHVGGVFAVAFSPDGAILASGSDDETIRLWELATGVCVATLRAEGPYSGMNIAGAMGLTEAQRAALKALGAVEHR